MIEVDLEIPVTVLVLANNQGELAPLKIDPKAPRRKVCGLTEAEKKAFVFQVNHARRNLSQDQRRELRKVMKQVAEELREEDAKKNTQAVVARKLGVAQQTVSDWFSNNTESGNGTKDPPPKPDARVILSKEAKEKAAKEVEKGKSQAQVAAEFGIGQQWVSTLLPEEDEEIMRNTPRRITHNGESSPKPKAKRKKRGKPGRDITPAQTRGRGIHPLRRLACEVGDVLQDKARHLHEIHAAPEQLWPVVVEGFAEGRDLLAAECRRTEVLIGKLLGPAEQGGDRRSEDFKSPTGDLKSVPEKDRYKFRLMAEEDAGAVA
jgi:transcriptional regulator with XRE-family HTH domain